RPGGALALRDWVVRSGPRRALDALLSEACEYLLEMVGDGRGGGQAQHGARQRGQPLLVDRTAPRDGAGLVARRPCHERLVLGVMRAAWRDGGGAVATGLALGQARH